MTVKYVYIIALSNQSEQILFSNKTLVSYLFILSSDSRRLFQEQVTTSKCNFIVQK